MEDQVIIDNAKELLGVALPVSKPPRTDVVFSFNQDQIYMGLKMVQDYDKDKQQYKQAEPRIVLSINGNYQYVPLESSLFKNWGQFLKDLGTLVEEIEIPQEEVNIEEIRKRILACIKGADSSA